MTLFMEPIHFVQVAPSSLMRDRQTREYEGEALDLKMEALGQTHPFGLLPMKSQHRAPCRSDNPFSSATQ